MVKNRLIDLNDHLFTYMERLGDEGLSCEDLEKEINRSRAAVAIADQIIENAKVQVAACKLMVDQGNRT